MVAFFKIEIKTVDDIRIDIIDSNKPSEMEALQYFIADIINSSKIINNSNILCYFNRHFFIITGQYLSSYSSIFYSPKRLIDIFFKPIFHANYTHQHSIVFFLSSVHEIFVNNRVLLNCLFF